MIATATSSGSGHLNGWIDFNADGDWDDAGEQVLTDHPVVAGANALQLVVPAGATLGSTIARFRLTGSGATRTRASPRVSRWKTINLRLLIPHQTRQSMPPQPSRVTDREDHKSSGATFLDFLIAIPAPFFSTFEHPLSLFHTAERPRRMDSFQGAGPSFSGQPLQTVLDTHEGSALISVNRTDADLLPCVGRRFPPFRRPLPSSKLREHVAD